MQDVYQRGVDACERNLRGRIMLNKGDKPYTSHDIKQKLNKKWNTTCPWTMFSLRRGYYEFTFASYEDLRTVWAMETVNLKPGVLRLFEWTKDFNVR